MLGIVTVNAAVATCRFSTPWIRYDCRRTVAWRTGDMQIPQSASAECAVSDPTHPRHAELDWCVTFCALRAFAFAESARSPSRLVSTHPGFAAESAHRVDGMTRAKSPGMNATSQAVASYTLLDTITVPNPLKSAQIFAACLAADKGYSSRLVKVARGIVDVVASDGRAIRYTHALRAV